MMAQGNTTTLRIWSDTKRQLDVVVAETGMNLIRSVEALLQAWLMLDGEQQRCAIAESTTRCGGGASHKCRQVWLWTHQKLNGLSRQTGMPKVRLIDAMTFGWAMLDNDQRRQAIFASAPAQPGPQTR